MVSKGSVNLMRIVSFASTPPRMEKNIRLHQLLKGLASLGYEVHHYGIRPIHIENTRSTNIPYHRITLREGVFWHEFYSPRFIRKLVVLYALLMFLGSAGDIVIAKDPLSIMAAYPRRLAGYLIFDYEDIISLELALRGYLKAAKKYLYFERLAAGLSNLTITENTYLQRYLLKAVGLSPSKVIVVPNGVDLNLFDPSRYDPEEVREELKVKGPLIGFSGKSIYPYYLDLLFRAAPLIFRHNPDARILIIGNKEGWMSKYGKVLNRVVFTGYVSYDKVPKYLSAIDVAVNVVSRLKIGSIKILEYLSMAKPVVTTTKLINDHAVKSGACSIVRPDPNEVGEAVNRLLSNPEERLRMGRLGRIYAEKFDWSLITRSFLQAIMKLNNYRPILTKNLLNEK